MIYVIEAKVWLSRRKFTGISDSIEDCASYFRDWALKNGIKPGQIRSARLYNATESKRIGRFSLLPDGNVLIEPEG